MDVTYFIYLYLVLSYPVLDPLFLNTMKIKCTIKKKKITEILLNTFFKKWNLSFPSQQTILPPIHFFSELKN